MATATDTITTPFGEQVAATDLVFSRSERAEMLAELESIPAVAALRHATA